MGTTYESANMAVMEVSMGANMSAKIIVLEWAKGDLTADVQEAVKARAFSGGLGPQSAPADSV